MDDQKLGALILGAAAGGLIGLWIYGALGGILGACLGVGGVLVGSLMVRRRI